MVALLIGALAALYQPLPTGKLEVHILADGSAWAVTKSDVSVPADGITLLWDLSPLNGDASRARLALPPTLELVWSAVRGSAALWHVQPADGVPRRGKLQAAAPLRDLKATWVHRVTVAGDRVRWIEAVRLSGWKGQVSGPASVVVESVKFSVDLWPGRAVLVPIRAYDAIRFREVVRWDSKDTSAGCVRTLVIERPANSAFGRQRIRAGELIVARGRSEARMSFGGAAPGQTVELAAGRAEGITVSRVRATSKQINVRQDVHRRVAAYDEQIDYEYAVMNGSPRPAILEIVEHPPRGWKVTASNHPWRRKDADTLILTVELKPRERVTVKISVMRANQMPQ